MAANDTDGGIRTSGPSASTTMPKGTALGRVLRLLYTSKGALTKQQVARTLGLSMPTVYQALSFLANEGLVRDAGELSSTGGRRAQTFSINERGRLAAGISVTAHGLRIVICDLRGAKVATSRPALEMPGAAAGATMASELTRVAERNGVTLGSLVGVTIAVPGVIDPAAPDAVLAPTLSATPLSAASLASGIEALGIPVRVENDACCGGFAEWFQTPGTRDLAYLSLEEGVGGAILARGSTLAGDNGRAAEFGHLCVEPGGLPCSCGQRGCLEAYCSTHRLTTAEGANGYGPVGTPGSRGSKRVDPASSTTPACPATPTDLDAFFGQLDAGDADARKAWDAYASHLARGVHDIRMVLDCDVVLGGAVTVHLAPRLSELRERVGALDPFGSDARYLRLCRHPADGVPLGGALEMVDRFIRSA